MTEPSPKLRKKEVSSLGVLRYFDPHAETVIETDASLKGLGAVLLQEGKPVCYASKALTETKQQYSNIECKAVGIIWGLERFHYFIYGKSCTIHTDHKPLDDLQEEAKQLPCEITEVCTTSSEVQRYREVCIGSRGAHRRCPLQSITTASPT